MAVRALIWVTILSYGCIFVNGAGLNELCFKPSDCNRKLNQVCADHGRCRCTTDAIMFAKTCVTRKQHGEWCAAQIECSMSGDPYLQCEEHPTPLPNGERYKMCMCDHSTKHSDVTNLTSTSHLRW